MQNLGFRMHVPNSLTYSDVSFCPGAEEPAAEELAQMPSNKRALFMMSSNAYAKKQIATALSRHPAFRVPHKSLLCVPTCLSLRFYHAYAARVCLSSRLLVPCHPACVGDFFDRDPRLSRFSSVTCGLMGLALFCR